MDKDNKTQCDDCQHRATRAARVEDGSRLGREFAFSRCRQGRDQGSRGSAADHGDQFVFVLGDKKGEVIKVEDLPLGGPQQLAYPMEPASKCRAGRLPFEPSAADPPRPRAAHPGR